MDKRARIATIAWRLGQRQLPNDIACKALDYLSTNELPGLYVSSKGMRDLVTFYMEQRCEVVQFGGQGYTENWAPGSLATAHSVCRLAKRVRVLNVHTDRKVHLLVRLLRANAATLQSFRTSACVHPSVFVALASCHGLVSIRAYYASGHPNLWKTAALVLAKSIRNLQILDWYTIPCSQSDATSILLGHSPPPLQELVTQRLAEYSVLCHSNLSQLRVLRLRDIHRPAPAQLASLARGIASLPALETLECWFREVPAVVNLRTEQPAWNLPNLTRLNINYPHLFYLPRLYAPALTGLQAHVAPADLPDLMEGCPLLQEQSEPRFGAPSESPAAVAPANLSAFILANSGWRESLTHLTVQPPGLHPAAVAAIASRWHKLDYLSLCLRRGASPLVVRMLLESLPVLRALTFRSHPVGEEEAAAVSAFRPHFSPSEKEVPALNDLSLSIADDALFAGLSFPSLEALTLRAAQATITNIFAVLPRMPCLDRLELEDNAAVAAPAATGYRHPCGIGLWVHRCTALGPETLVSLLDAMPLLGYVDVMDCPRLRAEEVLLLLSGYSSWESLSCVVVNTHSSQPLPPLDDDYATLVGILLDACPALESLRVEETRPGWTTLPNRLVSQLRRQIANQGIVTEVSFGQLDWDPEGDDGDG